MTASTGLRRDRDRTVRANGVLHNGSTRLFQVKRGVGSGFVSHTNTSGTLNLALTLPALTTNFSVAIESNVRWVDGLPQYLVGHPQRVAAIRAAVGAVPGLGVAGAAYGGVGVPACIRDACRAVAALA